MKESKLSRLIKRIGCLFGNHLYKPEYMDFVCVDRYTTYGIYRVKCNCFYCNHEYNGLVKIPYPEAEILVKEVANNG